MFFLPPKSYKWDLMLRSERNNPGAEAQGSLPAQQSCRPTRGGSPQWGRQSPEPSARHLLLGTRLHEPNGWDHSNIYNKGCWTKSQAKIPEERIQFILKLKSNTLKLYFTTKFYFQCYQLAHDFTPLTLQVLSLCTQFTL